MRTVIIVMFIYFLKMWFLTEFHCNFEWALTTAIVFISITIWAIIFDIKEFLKR